MKKFIDFWKMAALMCCAMVCFTACGDDGDDATSGRGGRNSSDSGSGSSQTNAYLPLGWYDCGIFEKGVTRDLEIMVQAGDTERITSQKTWDDRYDFVTAYHVVDKTTIEAVVAKAYVKMPSAYFKAVSVSRYTLYLAYWYPWKVYTYQMIGNKVYLDSEDGFHVEFTFDGTNLQGDAYPWYKTSYTGKPW